MMKICDLHTHSTFSDGTKTPEEIIDECIKRGISAVALTDHNTVSGLERFACAAQGKNIEAVCGVEISTDYKEKTYTSQAFLSDLNGSGMFRTFFKKPMRENARARRS